MSEYGLNYSIILFFTLRTVLFLLSLAYNLSKLVIYCTGLKHVIKITQKFFFLFSSISKACKFDFEAGIHGWKRTGTAFNNQPTYGDNPTARKRGQPANQQGDWWIGGAENRPSKATTPGLLQGDGPQGTLSSPFFTIVGKRISFLIGGGCDIDKVRAELIVDHQVRQPDRIAFSF